jgi:hypothetical protein
MSGISIIIKLSKPYIKNEKFGVFPVLNSDRKIELIF